MCSFATYFALHMSIIRKVKSVERLFAKLDQEIHVFQGQTGLHCYAGCGKCCTKPDIEASPLEFLPLAFHWFLTGKAEEMLAKIDAQNDGICIAYSPLSILEKAKGSCSEYPHRGLICRLFGYGASKDKLGQLRLVTCRLIKEGQAEDYQKAVASIAGGQFVPIFTDYYQNLLQVDFKMGNTILPINEAIREAIEAVLQYYAYRPFPRMRKAA